MYLCSSCCLSCMFQFKSHRYIWFTVVSLIPLMLFVITCTCIPESHHLIMYTYIYYARHLTSLCVLAGLRLTTLDSHVQILESRPWRLYCSWSEWRSRSVDWQLPIRTLLLPAPPWSTCEILVLLLVSTFPFFIAYILLLCYLVIIYFWDIISCLVIMVYWCYYCWIVC